MDKEPDYTIGQCDDRNFLLVDQSMEVEEYNAQYNEEYNYYHIDQTCGRLYGSNSLRVNATAYFVDYI